MRVLITGAGGYLGRGVIQSLATLGADVIASARNMPSNAYSDVRWIEGDIFEQENPFIYYGKPDVLLHLAWRKGFVHNDVSHMNDLPMHYEFVSKMIDGGVSKVVVLGSMHEVGFYEGSIDENTPCRPQSLYGISKNALREATRLLTDRAGILWQWLRGYYIVGNTEYGSSIFSKITQAERDGQKLFPFTSGLNQWDFMNYDDFCHMTAKTTMQDKINGIINVCSGRPEKLSERVERFIKDMNYNIKLDYGKFPDRPYDSKAVWGNSSKIEAVRSYRL